MELRDFNVQYQKVGDLLVVLHPSTSGVIYVEVVTGIDIAAVDGLRAQVESDARLIVAKLSEESESRRVLANYGRALFGAILPGRIGLEFERRFKEDVQGKANGLRLRFILGSGAEGLAALPLEAIFWQQFDQHAALHSRFSLTRMAAAWARDDLPPIAPPLRILLVEANPKHGLHGPQLDTKREIEQLRTALDMPRIIETDVVPHATLEATIRKAQSWQPHVLHFIGHGVYDEDRREGQLVFEDGRGGAVRASATQLRTRLTGVASVRLFTINACLGNRGNADTPESAIAWGVFNLGLIPAVVAMQWRVTDASAIVFARSFYRQIAAGRPIDAAMTDARQAMAEDGSPEWVIPVLYLGTATGKLFGLELPLSDLLEFGRGELKRGKWDAAAKLALLAQEQHRGEPVADRVMRVAEGSRSFVTAWSNALRRIRPASGGHAAIAAQRDLGTWPRELENPTEVLGKMYEAAREYPISDAEDLDLKDAPEFRDLVLAIEAARALSEQDFERAEELAGRREAVSWVDWELIAVLNENVRVVSNAREIFDRQWRIGDWDALVSAAERIERAGGHGDTELQRRCRVAMDLKRVAGALEDGNYSGAMQVLDQIDQTREPANVSVVRRLVGAALAAETGVGEEAVAGLERQLSIAELALGDLGEGRVAGSQRVRRYITERIQEARYATALDAYERGVFATAAEGWRALGDYRDAPIRLRHAESWTAAIEALRARQWNDARTRLASLGALDDPRVKLFRQWCNRVPRVVTALDRLRQSNFVCDAMVPVPDLSVAPYVVFAPFGVTPDSTIAQCRDAGMEAQQRGGMERTAWDALRLPLRRLLVDFGLYEVRDRERCGRVVERITDFTGGQPAHWPMEDRAADVGGDWGTCMALAGNHELAIEVFRREAIDTPWEPRALHHLGIAAAARIQWLEEHAGTDAELHAAWEQLIIGWSPIFANDAFWHQMWTRRRSVYGESIKGAQIQEVRTQIRKYWVERATTLGLDGIFNAEIKGASAVQTGGGIVVRGHPVVLGQLAVRMFGLTAVVADWMSAFDDDRDHLDSWQARARRYFSELAEASALFEEERYGDVVRELGRTRCRELQRGSTLCRVHKGGDGRLLLAVDGCACFRDNNPGFAGSRNGAALLHLAGAHLLEEANMKLALQSLSASPTDVDVALQLWEGAVETARGVGNVGAVLDSVRNVAVGRARYLCDPARESREDAIHDAIRLLQGILDREWDGAHRPVREALADCFIARAIFVSNAYDDEERARDSALEAYRLLPGAVRTLEALSHFTLLFAQMVHSRGEQERAKNLVQEAEGWLGEGERLFPHHPRWPMARGRITEAKAYVEQNAAESLDQLLRSMRGDAPESTGGSDRFTDAIMHEAQQEFRQATTLYRALLEENPTNREVQSKLAWCYHRWILNARETAPAGELRALVREARAQCPNSEALRDLLGGQEDQYDDAD